MRWEFSLPQRDTVDLYYCDLDAPEHESARLASSLSLRERERAKRFRFERHRRRFVLARGFLRELLGALTKNAPAEVPMKVGPDGKPFLLAGPAFSLSHSEQHLLIAVGAEGNLGVDVELRRPIPDALVLARNNFTSEEIAALQQFSGTDLSASFLRVWTRKEALLKAVGTGLSLPPNQVSVAVSAGEDDSLRASCSALIDVRRWCVRSVTVREELEAAVAWDKPDFEWRMIKEWIA